MKKLFTLIMLFGIIGCNSSGVVSEANVKKALDIAYNNTTASELGYYNKNISDVEIFLHNYQNFKDTIECTILDTSNAEGKRANRACLLKEVIKLDTLSEPLSMNALVIAEEDRNNRDRIFLTFFTHAEKTEQGYKFNSSSPIKIVVNLATQKIGDI